MNRRSDEAGPISWQDAFQVWRETEQHYGVHLELRSIILAREGNRLVLSQVIHVSRLTGKKGFTREFSRPMAYPARQYSTYPAALVYHISWICTELERRRLEEERALKQADMFSAAQ